MDIRQAFNIITGIEAEFDTSRFDTNLPPVGQINLWPIIRHCLWAELLRWTPLQPANAGLRERLAGRMRHHVNQLRRAAVGFTHTSRSVPAETTKLFLSRPPYLQLTPDGLLTDRVMDPLIFSLDPSLRSAKLYLSPWRNDAPLAISARWLRAGRMTASLPATLSNHVDAIAQLAGIEPDRFAQRTADALAQFLSWYMHGSSAFSRCSALKDVYLTSWYFPDMMGLTAAARQVGARVTEVQHGKQGRFQAMYSGWSRIPDGPTGYLMMPDRFWCWGEPSCHNMLEGQPPRQTHLPFVGGYPWIDYFRQAFTKNKAATATAKAGIRIIFSLQPELALNPVPVPDGFIDILKDSANEVHFTFKLHPNDSGGRRYIDARLADVPKSRFRIVTGQTSLYELFEDATHHVTAFSSCCYEATVFKLPTLLFGKTSAQVYSREIAEGQFSWTTGDRIEIEHWFRTASPSNVSESKQAKPYIVSSMTLAADLLNENSCLGDC